MKFIQPVEITAEYKITTPMFLGGADPTESIDHQQFRNASLKGALRFWWRALNWGRMLTESSGNLAEALKALHQREGALFGKASDSNQSLQSQIQLSSELTDTRVIADGDKSLKAVSYLLGMGLYDYKIGTLRPALAEGRLSVIARFKPSTPAEDVAEVRQALIALGVFGALGSRARKGLGSLSIQSLRGSEPQAFSNRQDIQRFVDSLDFSAAVSDAPLSAFGVQSRIDITPGGRSPMTCLQQISQCLQLYRDGTVQGHERESNFKQDRVLAAEAAKGRSIASLPKRAVFGLPHNYFWIDTKAKLDIAPKEATRNRRASPLFIHVHQFPDGQCSIIQTLLPGMFLPPRSTIELKGKGSTFLDTPAVDFSVIEHYMNRFINEHKGEVLRHAR